MPAVTDVGITTLPEYEFGATPTLSFECTLYLMPSLMKVRFASEKSALLSIVTDVRLSQPSNTSPPMLSTMLPMVSVFSEEQFLNALSEILLTVGGMVIDSALPLYLRSCVLALSAYTKSPSIMGVNTVAVISKPE